MAALCCTMPLRCTRRAATAFHYYHYTHCRLYTAYACTGVGSAVRWVHTLLPRDGRVCASENMVSHLLTTWKVDDQRHAGPRRAGISSTNGFNTVRRCAVTARVVLPTVPGHSVIRGWHSVTQRRTSV
jgi:hypothetical protein